MTPESIMDWLCEIIGAASYDISSESALQRGIAERLKESGVYFTKEARLSPEDRIDFMVGVIGIEVKIGGGKAALVRQLHRYAQSPDVVELLLVTTAPALASIPHEFNGKAIRSLVLSACLI